MLQEEIEMLKRKLRASEVKNTKLEMQLNGLKVEYGAQKDDLGEGRRSLSGIPSGIAVSQ